MLQARRQPAEWAPHEAVFIGWPSAADLWGDDLAPARAEIAAFIAAVAPGELVELVYRGAEARAAAEAMRAGLTDPAAVRLHEAPIGDVWLRDTGPIFVREESGARAASCFSFNGWGGKYELPEDDRIAEIVAGIAGARLRRFDGLVAEGGALETDGEGTFVTTRQCLLNPNRNPGVSEAEIEAALKAALGAEKVIWLDEGLLGDHTDGHVDNLARFIAPGRIVCMRPYGKDDPNRDVLNAVRAVLSRATDAAGRKLDLIEIPSPGLAMRDGAPEAASHVNFFIGNSALVMPVYAGLTGDSAPGAEAAALLEEAGAHANVVAVDSSHLLSGGGSFHCISQQMPA